MDKAIELKLGTHIPLGDSHPLTKWLPNLIHRFATRWPNVEIRKFAISLMNITEIWCHLTTMSYVPSVCFWPQVSTWSMDHFIAHFWLTCEPLSSWSVVRRCRPALNFSGTFCYRYSYWPQTCRPLLYSIPTTLNVVDAQNKHPK